MAYVSDILASKGGAVRTISASATVLDAINVMNEQQIGALVVSNGGGKVAGMFTERDVLRRVVGERHDPAAVKVGDVMTEAVVCVQPETPLADVQSLMKQRRIRHLPVVDGNRRLVGLISIGDVNAHFARDVEIQVNYLHEYIYGRT